MLASFPDNLPMKNGLLLSNINCCKYSKDFLFSSSVKEFEILEKIHYIQYIFIFKH